MAKTKIKLTRDASTNEFEEGFTVKKVVVRVGDQWLQAEWDTLRKQTFDTLIGDGVRFMVDCSLNDNRVFIVTHEADVEPIKQKYLGCSIIYLKQIIGLLAGLPKKIEGFGMVPELLMKLSAEVIGYGKDEKTEEYRQARVNFKA